MRTLVTVWCLCICATNAYSEVEREGRYGMMTTSKLVELWNSSNRVNNAIAYGYLMGTFDSMTTADGVCLPPNIASEAVFKRIVEETVRSTKSLGGVVKVDMFPASAFLLPVAKNVYPCSPKKP